METRLYHRTTLENADRILVSGFYDGPVYEELSCIRGVWLSDIPLDLNEGARGDTLLQVSIAGDENEFADYELLEEGKPYREWCIPAALVNAILIAVLPVVENAGRNDGEGSSSGTAAGFN